MKTNKEAEAKTNRYFDKLDLYGTPVR
jgi:hypothetical protein